MKKKFLCLFLGIWLCLSFSLPLYALDGTINADDNAELVRPTLEITDTPGNAFAVARSLDTNMTYYYRVDGEHIWADSNEDFYEPGWMPETNYIDGVIGDDDRERVSTQEGPFSAIAMLEIFFPQGNVQLGTATMISPNAAFTAAHNLYCRELGGWAVHIKVTPGIYGWASSPTNPFGYTSVRELVISVPAFEDETENDGVDCDWGLIRLNMDLGNRSGFLGFQFRNNSFTNHSVMISGYPLDLNFLAETYNQYMHIGTIDSDNYFAITVNYEIFENRIFTYDIDATGGQSGSPILYFNNGAYQIIGIHTAGSGYNLGDDDAENDVYTHNLGFGITSELYGFLYAYKYAS